MGIASRVKESIPENILETIIVRGYEPEAKMAASEENPSTTVMGRLVKTVIKNVTRRTVTTIS